MSSAIADLIELGGAGLSVVDPGVKEDDVPAFGPGVICVGVHDGGPRPWSAFEAFDILLTTDDAPPAPWVAVADLQAALGAIRAQVDAQPVACAAAAQTLRASLRLSFDGALAQESLAYSMPTS